MAGRCGRQQSRARPAALWSRCRVSREASAPGARSSPPEARKAPFTGGCIRIPGHAGDTATTSSESTRASPVPALDLARPIAGWSGPRDFSAPPRMPLERQPRRHKRLHRQIRLAATAPAPATNPTAITAATAGPDWAKAGGFQTWVSSQTCADNRGSAVEVRLSATYDATGSMACRTTSGRRGFTR